MGRTNDNTFTPVNWNRLPKFDVQDEIYWDLNLWSVFVLLANLALLAFFTK